MESSILTGMDKEQALAICFTNLKGSKDKDLLRTAQALQFLWSLPEYRSNEKVGAAVGVTGEIVREFLTLVKLPKYVQALFEQRKLTKLEQARSLWQLARTRPDLLEETVKAVTGMLSWDARHLVNYIMRNPNSTVTEAKERILSAKTKIQREYHVIAILSEDEYKKLSVQAGRKKIPVDVLVTNIVKDWQSSQQNG